MVSILMLAAALQAAAPPPANDPRLTPACASRDAALPPELAGWTQTGERLVPGHAVVLPAAPDANPEPGQRPGNVTTIAFSVPVAGIYGIALDQAGWVDLLPVMDRGAPRPLVSASHGHGPSCSTIRKIVRFQLNAGTYYSVSLTGLQGTSARVMLVAPESP